MKIIIVAALLSGCVLTVFAQSDVQVDPLTGRAIFGIPIGQVSVGSISAPISIGYDGGGVLVDGGEGSAGVGWNLAAGGSIVRILRGLPDDYNVSGDSRKGWLNSSARSTLASFSPAASYGCADWTTVSGFAGTNDTEPDLFAFNAPGLSGKFVYDNSGNIQLMPYQDVKITGSPDTYFVITTNQGIVYTFDFLQGTQYTMSEDHTASPFDRRYALMDSVTCTSVYYLSSIAGTAGEHIDFDYTSQAVVNSRDLVQQVNNSLSGLSPYYSIYESYVTNQLTSISTSNGASSADITWSGNIVSHISLTRLGASHTFKLGYTPEKNSAEDTVNIGTSGYRNYLTSVTENSDCNMFPSFTFEYYSPELLPYKKEYPRDFFGYYNGKTGTDDELPVPSLYQNNSAANGEVFRIRYKSGYSTVSSSDKRDVSASYIYYGSLKKINYPSGGFCQITWEPNKYYDAANSADALGAGVRVSSLKASDGDADTTNNIIRNYEYKKSDGSSSGHWTYNPSFAFLLDGDTIISPVNLAPEQTILYDRSTVIYPGNGKTVSEFNMPVDTGTGLSGTPVSVRSVAQNTGTCPDDGSGRHGYYVYPFSPDNVSDFTQGQISKIQHYNQAGTLLKEQNYTYQTQNATPVNIYGMKLDGNSIKYYGLYLWYANTGMTTQTESVTTYDMQATSNAITSSTNYTLNANDLISQIAVTNSDGKVSKVKNSYAGDFSFGSTTDSSALMIKKLLTLNMHGTVVESVSLVEDSVMGASLTLFRDWGTSHVFPKQQLKYVGNGVFDYSTDRSTSTEFKYDTAYRVQNTVESFNTIGLPLSTYGLDRSVSAVVYGPDKSTPIAAISGARGSEIVFSDFENSESYQIAAFNNVITSWSGAKSRQLYPDSSISRTNVMKSGAPRYRFRCRAKAADSGNLTVELSNNSSGWNTTTITYGASGQWVLFDVLISMSTVAQPFTLKLTAHTNDVTLDDIAFYPENASLQSMTYTPFAGKTSQTDNRGYSAFYEYDGYDRLVLVRNSDRNVVQSHGYRYKGQSAPAINSGFTCSTDASLITGQAFTFTANSNGCASGLTYQWKVNDVSAGTSSFLVYTFTESRVYTVSLTVSGTVDFAATSGTVCADYLVLPTPFHASISGDLGAFDCTDTDDDGVRLLSVVAEGCGSEGDMDYQWQIANLCSPLPCEDMFFDMPGKTDSTLTVYGNEFSSTVKFRCRVISSCGVGYYANSLKPFTDPVTFTIVTHDPPCPR